MLVDLDFYTTEYKCVFENDNALFENLSNEAEREIILYCHKIDFVNFENFHDVTKRNIRFAICRYIEIKQKIDAGEFIESVSIGDFSRNNLIDKVELLELKKSWQRYLVGFGGYKCI